MILTLVQQNESFNSKLLQGKHFKLRRERVTVESFDIFVRGSPIFTLNEFRRVIYQYSNRINTFQCKICCLNSKTFSENVIFVIRDVKRKWKIRYLICFLAQWKERLNKQNSPTCYYSIYLRFLEVFFVTKKTTQGYVFINTFSNNL